ncbi:hypothetical protein QJS10_CPA03g01907 [Acorus calamus]|uniref:Myb/SANT-like domain-containing protein n=1 Tax=Acorus calamus TaxID=4465 RepID=A0AAV9F8P8_ACOCL|nr:hypothetical protein QJS10_CPA03g01907 [Acorus calamus]
MSRFMQKFLVEQVEKGMKIDKTFKRPAFIAIARAVNSNVENHLRTLKTKYSQIKRLKNMSGVGWDDTLKLITMDDDIYNEYVQAHPKDEPYLNKPIEMCDEMIIICGDDQATGSFAQAMSEPVVDVDARSNFGANNDESEEMKDKTKENDNASNGITKGGRKRSRNIESKFDMLIDKLSSSSSTSAHFVVVSSVGTQTVCGYGSFTWLSPPLPPLLEEPFLDEPSDFFFFLRNVSSTANTFVLFNAGP